MNSTINQLSDTVCAEISACLPPNILSFLTIANSVGATINAMTVGGDMFSAGRDIYSIHAENSKVIIPLQYLPAIIKALNGK